MIDPVECYVQGSHTNTHLDVTDDNATVAYYVFVLSGVSHAERWKAFFITATLTHTQAREVTQQGGGEADNEREKGRDLSQAFSPPISPRTRPRPNTLPHNTHTRLLGGRNTTTFGNHNNECMY